MRILRLPAFMIIARPDLRIILLLRLCIDSSGTDEQIARTQSGMLRAKSEGNKLGRPKILSTKQCKLTKYQLAKNPNISQLERDFNVSRKTK